MDSQSLLELRAVSATVTDARRLVPILVGVSLTINRGEIVGLVGESGSGKSMTARTVMSSIPSAISVTGEVLLEGRDILGLPAAELRKVRARSLGVIFQDARLAVDPLWTIEDHVTEGMRVHAGLTRGQARAKAIALLRQVGIRDADRRLAQYPGQLSGGMLQRVVIAGALAGDPSLIIADEPTTALDVTTQAEIVAIFAALRRDRGLAMLFITHDLGLAASLCDRILVMYAGRIVEAQTSAAIFTRPAHPYTQALVAARPSVKQRQNRLPMIPGTPSGAADAPEGCPFRLRCGYAIELCRAQAPALRMVSGGLSACHRSEEIRERLHV
jgi:oligopeptide/dipeptide ABC transporter ATP-binding protein